MALTGTEFRSLFAENDLVEWKEGTSADRIQAAVVAFSNSDGGIIQIGVRNDGHIVGRSLDDNAVLRLNEIVLGVRNPGRFSLHPLLVDDRSIIVLSIERRHEGFAQLPNGQVLVRRGKSNRGLFGQDLATFVNSRLLTRFESTPVGIPLAAIDNELLKSLARAFGWTNEDEWPDRLVEKGLAVRTQGDDIELTVAGTLFHCPMYQPS